MSDSVTTIQSLKDELKEFVRQRDWAQFHSPKNLAMSVAIEAAELMEHFQWLQVEESRSVCQNPEKSAEIAEEVADVLAYVLALANVMDLDLATVFQKKMIKNRLKYPAADYHGRWDRSERVPQTDPDDV